MERSQESFPQRNRPVPSPSLSLCYNQCASLASRPCQIRARAHGARYFLCRLHLFSLLSSALLWSSLKEERKMAKNPHQKSLLEYSEFFRPFLNASDALAPFSPSPSHPIRRPSARRLSLIVTSNLELFFWQRQGLMSWREIIRFLRFFLASSHLCSND